MERDSREMDLNIKAVVDFMFPFQVFQDCEMEAPEGGPVLTLEAGFREEKDAELFADIKKKSTGGKYVVRGTNGRGNPDKSDKMT